MDIDRETYIELIMDFCNRRREEAERAIDEALKRRKEKRRNHCLDLDHSH